MAAKSGVDGNEKKTCKSQKRLEVVLGWNLGDKCRFSVEIPMVVGPRSCESDETGRKAGDR